MREKEPPRRIRVSRIELTEQFYEDEVREGFYIPAEVKQAWGAQIRVLNEVDRVCKELGIRYFADWGTFLGAVRHGGFIPWDDDFDICMLRDDYLRFLDEGVKLLPQGYMVYNLKNKEDHEQFVANIVALNRICFEEDHLDKFHGFPYIAAIDVFIIDYVSPDADEQEAMRKRARYILSISDGIRNGTLKGEALKDRLSDLKEKTGISVPNGLGDAGIRRFLDMEAEREFASFLPQIGTTVYYFCGQKINDYDRKENHHPRRLQRRAVQKRRSGTFRGRHHYGMDVGPRLRAAISVLPGGRRLRPTDRGVAARVGLARQYDQIAERWMLVVVCEMPGRQRQLGLVQKPSQRPYRPRHQGAAARIWAKVSHH